MSLKQKTSRENGSFAVGIARHIGHLQFDMSPSDLVLGIDGGGTKTVAWLAPRHDPSESDVVGRGPAGAENPLTVGLSAATLNQDDLPNRGELGATKSLIFGSGEAH